MDDATMDFTVSEPTDLISSAGSLASMASGNPLFAIGGQLLGGLFGKSSAKSQNKQAAKLMREQMAWQEKMSNTQHQRNVADLRAAGLNPILSATKGPGAMPASVSAAPVVDEGAAGRASAIALSRAAAELELIHAQTAKTKAEALTEAQRPENVSMQTKLSLSQAMNYEATATLAKNQSLMVAAQEVNQTLINNINQSTLDASKKNELRKLIAERKVSEADAERAKTDQEFFKSEIGSIVRTAEIIVRALGLSKGR